jgi:preprotein translocase subunit SecG
VKVLKIATVIAVIALISVSLTLVSALEQNEATADVFWSNHSPSVGDLVTVRINFQSSSQNQILITNIGVHGDWMPTDRYYGPSYSPENPVTVPSSGSFMTGEIQIPLTGDAGTHTYYVGVNGVDSTGANVEWTSTPATITFLPPGSNTATPTANPSGGDVQTAAGPNWLVYGTVIAAAIVLVILIVVLLMMRKKRSAPRQTMQPTQKPETPQPEEQPDTGKDFDI